MADKIIVVKSMEDSNKQVRILNLAYAHMELY